MIINNEYLNQQKLIKRIKEILSANDNLFPNFYNKYLEIDKLLRTNQLKNDIIYDFKDTCECTFKVCSNEKNTIISLKIKDKTICLGKENSFNETFSLCEQIDEEIASRRLFFSPAPDKEFIKDILSAKKGDILSYNNRNAFVCINDEPGNIVLKYAFHGDINNIKINDFNKTETFYIKDENSHDLKYIYSLAYDYKSVSAIRRKFDFELGNGYYPIKDIEDKHIYGTVTECNIGNCKLRLTDKNNELIWYDIDGMEISRDTIALLFAWTKTVAADVQLINQYWEPNPEIDKALIEKINENIVDRNVDKIISLVKDYAIQNNNYASVSFSGLIQENINFIPVTFAFSYDDDKLYVYKMIHDINENIVEQSLIDEFMTFYKQRYEDIKNITLKQFKNYNEKEQEILFKKLIEKSSNKNILGQISSDEKSTINDLLNSYIKDKNSYCSLNKLITIEEYESSDI